MTTAAIRDRKAARKRFLNKLKYGYSNWLFLLPSLIGLSVFILYPIVMSLIYSFTDFNGISIRNIGTMNYADLFDFGRFGYGRGVLKSFGVTAVYTLVSIPVNVVLSFTLALALNKAIPGIRSLRLFFYLPVLIPGIVAGQIWTDILSYPSGLINQWLAALGLPKGTFFSAEQTQLATLLVISQWGIGGGMIVWLAALQNISPTYYEAAELDGATYFSKLFRITVPMSSPIILYNLISLVIMCFQVFDSYAYLGRGINDAVYFVSVRIYVTAFGPGHEYGMACAVAWLLFVVIGALTALMFRTSKWVFYGEK